MVDKAELEKDKKNPIPSLSLPGLISALTVAMLALRSFEAACLVRHLLALTPEKLRAVPSSSWLIQQQEGMSSRLRD